MRTAATSSPFVVSLPCWPALGLLGHSLPGLCHCHSWGHSPAPGLWAGEVRNARGLIVLAEVRVPEVFVLKIHRDVSKEGGVLALRAAIEEGLEIIFYF